MKYFVIGLFFGMGVYVGKDLKSIVEVCIKNILDKKYESYGGFHHYVNYSLYGKKAWKQ